MAKLFLIIGSLNAATGDWFTDYVLSGEVPDKDGNKRLRKKMK